MNKTVELILERTSVRSFQDKIIPEEALQTIIKCGLYAPNAKNKQNWRFTVITDKERIDEISRLAVEGMVKIGLDINGDGHIFYHAPLVIVLSSKMDGNSLINAGCVVENMSLAAKSLGIGSCIIGQTRYLYHKVDKNDINRILKIPENYEYDISICFGYPTEKESNPKPRNESIVNYIR